VVFGLEHGKENVVLRELFEHNDGLRAHRHERASSFQKSIYGIFNRPSYSGVAGDFIRTVVGTHTTSGVLRQELFFWEGEAMVVNFVINKSDGPNETQDTFINVNRLFMFNGHVY